MADDRGQLNPALECGLCLDRLEDPYSCGHCGISYCSACWDGVLHLTNAANCPSCRGSLATLPVPNLALRDLLASYPLRPPPVPVPASAGALARARAAATGAVQARRRSGSAAGTGGGGGGARQVAAAVAAAPPPVMALPAQQPPPSSSPLTHLTYSLLLGGLLPVLFGELRLGCLLLTLSLPSLAYCAALRLESWQLPSPALDACLLAPALLLLLLPLPPALTPSISTLLLSAAPILALAAATTAPGSRQEARERVLFTLLVRNLGTAAYLSWGPVAAVLLLLASYAASLVALKEWAREQGQRLHENLAHGLAALCCLATAFYVTRHTDWLPAVGRRDLGYLLWLGLELIGIGMFWG